MTLDPPDACVRRPSERDRRTSRHHDHQPLDTNKAAQQIAKAGEGKIKAPALPAAQALVCTSFFADFCGTGNR
jgi:hypothetical protein